MTIEATISGKKPASAPAPMKAAVTSAKKPDYVEGRRTFFKYRDLGVTAASNGWMRAQLMTAVTGMTKPTGWHYHVCEGQFVYTLKGWVELAFEDGTNCRLEAGDFVLYSGRPETQRDRHIGRPRDPRNLSAVRYGDRPGRPAGRPPQRLLSRARTACHRDCFALLAMTSQ